VPACGRRALLSRGFNRQALAAVALLFTCTLDQRAAATEAHKTPVRPRGSVTFAKDVAPIIYANCTSCHRAGEVAPFALASYQDVKKRATQIASVVQSGYMPPWHADSHGEFLNERRLSDDQIGVLQQWVQEGARPGGAAPEPPKFAPGWSLGEPDVVLEPEKSYILKAEGTDVYRCFVLPNANAEDRYVSALEVRPGNAKVVHHVIAYLNADGKAIAKQEANTDGQPGYSSFGGIGATPSGSLGGWAPGNFPRRLPDGVGTLYPKGADIVLQIHYHPSGKSETDKTRVGIYYCKKPVDKLLRIYPVIAGLNIPAGDASYKVKSFDFPVPWDATVLEVMPHMHLLGKEMAITVTAPDGEKKPLVTVPRYDFSWQTTYVFKDPVKIAKGSKIGLTARYDNSPSNPRNPSNPPRTVSWGEQTTDEMCIGFVYYTLDEEHITQGKRMPPFGFGMGRRAAVGLIKGLLQRRAKPAAPPP
jgi:mono/diheme cytochrome c family protein